MFSENYFLSPEGLRLFYRDYQPADAAAIPLVCLHGLTRNSADFADFAQEFSPHYRLIAPDMRGRGRSEYDPIWQNYHLRTYVADVWSLLDELQVHTCVLVGMSMGGLMSMLMAAQHPERILGVILNDIGPELAPEGVERIMSYMEVEQASFTLDQAVARIKSVNQSFFPNLSDDDWTDFTLRIYKEVEDGRYQTSYDKGITRAILEGAAMPEDPWAAFAALAEMPSLVVRGGLSDLLSRDIIDKMLEVAPDMAVAEVPNIGHHPFLNEPEAVSAIKQLLNSFDGQRAQRI